MKRYLFGWDTSKDSVFIKRDWNAENSVGLDKIKAELPAYGHTVFRAKKFYENPAWSVFEKVAKNPGTTLNRHDLGFLERVANFMVRERDEDGRFHYFLTDEGHEEYARRAEEPAPIEKLAKMNRECEQFYQKALRQYERFDYIIHNLKVNAALDTLE